MPRINLSGRALLLLTIAVASRGAVESARAEPEKLIQVSVDDLVSGKAVVIGRLGVRLKTMMTVRGTWNHKVPGEHPTKPTGGPSFYVTHVNGKELDKPVEFYKSVVNVTYPLPRDESDKDSKEPTPSAGDTWELRAYETGAFRSDPPEFAKELGAPNGFGASPYWEPFLAELHGIMQRPGSPRKPIQRKTTTAKAKTP